MHLGEPAQRAAQDLVGQQGVRPQARLVWSGHEQRISGNLTRLLRITFFAFHYYLYFIIDLGLCYYLWPGLLLCKQTSL